MCWLPLVVAYPLELATTKQRGFLFSWMFFALSLSTFAVNYINPVGLENIGWRYYIITIVFTTLVLVVIYFFFVETKGLSLEEIATSKSQLPIFCFNGCGRFLGAKQADPQ